MAAPAAVRPSPSPAAILTTRERLLDSAARVIARDGYERARLVDVARDAGLTTGAVYSNFRDKEELFLAALERLQQGTLDVFGEAPQDLEDLVAGYREAAVRFQASSELQVLNFEMALLGARNPRVHAILDEAMHETVAAVAATLANTADGRGAEELSAAATLLVALGNGLALVRMFAPDLVTPELVDTALRRVGSEPAG